jgi:signal transduction histidine kinase
VPPTLGDLGLIESVQELVQTICLLQPLQIQFQHAGFSEEKLPENGKLMLYRIVQEALNNCIKHAQATTVQLTLKRNGGTVFLQVQDNGRGFASENIRKGLGLHNIRNRAEIFGGSLTVHSAPGAGCTIAVAIPDAFHFQET